MNNKRMKRTVEEVLRSLSEGECDMIHNSAPSWQDIAEMIKAQVHIVFPDIGSEDEPRAFRILLEQYWLTH
ncbi:hypothetical protein [Dysgonomonas sp. Marseille-P4361]|uniref:hypothetical protein n=1 Tax=Dysgonomonas sp. Marseille-P4361 TaxID=2161820 RepID=UPI000D559712|nr:hypothetical protein [Dysgonomonas sp. Marseille-P4361]